MSKKVMALVLALVLVGIFSGTALAGREWFGATTMTITATHGR
ncbi:MAG TPA: hypothetical protein VGK74_15180 [Symbiobacteriaceae bacterium]|jgi:hypothetical protein